MSGSLAYVLKSFSREDVVVLMRYALQRDSLDRRQGPLSKFGE